MKLIKKNKERNGKAIASIRVILVLLALMVNPACSESSLNNDQETDSESQQIPDSTMDSTTDTIDHSALDTNDAASELETGADSDTTPSFSNNYNMCLAECAIWAKDNVCFDEKETCQRDEDCNAYATCIETQCASLEGESRYSCEYDCRESNITSDQSLAYYSDIIRCASSDFCVPICIQLGADSEHNCETCFCYGNENDDETGCFLWAGAEGPCKFQQEACHANDACTKLEACIDATWSLDGDESVWEYYQAMCFEDAGTEVEELYWSYYQCIYCDACDVACAIDAQSKNCGEYLTQ